MHQSRVHETSVHGEQMVISEYPVNETGTSLCIVRLTSHIGAACDRRSMLID